MKSPSLAAQLSAQAEDEGTGHNRWMVSYADFLTLLFVLFVALYVLNQKQMQQKMAVVEEAHQALQAQQVKQQEIGVLSHAARTRLMANLQQQLGPLVQAGDIRLVERTTRVVLEIPDTALFASGDATASEQAIAVLSQVARALNGYTGPIQVEGHTDSVPINSAKFPSNWELSSARAASIVRALQSLGIDSTRLSAVGLADTHPVETDPRLQAKNRRVNLVLFE